MWKDNNDDILRVYKQLGEIPKFPAKCPVCKKESAHIYMHLYNLKTNRGGLWVWCSECFTFSHSSIYVPKYWKNSPQVEGDKLYAVPKYLEEKKDFIDRHVNEIMIKG
jgi:hypothetical protein